METLAHWSNGATLEAPADSRHAEVMNPATGEVSSKVALASAETTQPLPAKPATSVIEDKKLRRFI